MGVICAYFGCNSRAGEKPLFRFPVKRAKLLEAWIRNCGNEKLTSYPRQKLRSKYVCIDHFENKFVNHKCAKRKQLKGMAVPMQYTHIDSPNAPDSPDGSKSPGFCQTRMNETDRKSLIGPVVRYGIFQDCLTKKCGESEEIGDLSQPDDDQQCPDLTVLRPNKVYHNYHTQIRAEIAKELNHSNIRAAGNRCAECERSFHGFEWWCVQCPGARCGGCALRMAHRAHYLLRAPAITTHCPGARCGGCALRMAHRAHYLLRAPAITTHEQTKAVIASIRQHLGDDFLESQAELRHVDENGVDLIVTDEPEVKAEPPELEDDPFLCNPTDPLACNPSLDPLACNLKVEDPLAFNPAAEEPLESKPLIHDLANAFHQEPSIDYQESLQSLQTLVDPEKPGNSPFKPLGVEFYSPVHPGLESYEMALAQCSGIDDFRCSEWGDSHSIDLDTGDLDGQSSNDDHQPPSVKLPRVPTHYTYTGDDSDDSIKEIDYEQPSHSHTETDTEENQTNKPWVQVLSSQEQNITVSTKKHKRKTPQFQLPTSKGQNILAKRQNVQTKRPWVQVFSNTEQQSTAKWKNRRSEPHIEDSICEEQSSAVREKPKDRRSEQSHTEGSICEEQTTSVSEKQKNNSRSKQLHIEDSIDEEQTSAVGEQQKNHNRLAQSHTEDLICEEHISTVNEKQNETLQTPQKRKKKIIIIKKRHRYVRKRTKYPTHIRRDLEPTDRDIDSVREDTIDINMTTDSSNTLLNLEDYIREKVLEYPSDTEELT